MLVDPLIGREMLVGFSKNYYLRKNPDVAAAGVDPLKHYMRYGYKEGRQPSPIFEPHFYREQVGTISGSYRTDLEHFQSEGRRMGANPSRHFATLHISDLSVGVVIVAYNCSDIARLTIDSLIAAKTGVKVCIYLIDGGSRENERLLLEEYCSQYTGNNPKIVFIALDSNKGYSGSNNIGIQRAMSDGHSYVCLLNPDVIVSDFWLERLIAEQEPVIGPVCNSVGNEQTVPGPRDLKRELACVQEVNQFASDWAAAFKERTEATEFLGFFCVLFRREILEKVGLLDERFFPGGYEDLDLCLRIRQAGFELTIARHVYLHHWGSSSFANLPMEQRINHADTNKARYEAKHETYWIDWKTKILHSTLVDHSRATRTYKRRLRRFQNNVLFEHRRMSEQLIQELEDGEASSRRTLDRAVGAMRGVEREMELVRQNRDELVRLAKAAQLHVPLRLQLSGNMKVVTSLSPAVIPQFSDKFDKYSYEDFFYSVMNELVLAQRPFFWALQVFQASIYSLYKLLAAKPIIVFANGVEPFSADEKDGYVQRVLAIDSTLADRARIYFRTAPHHEEGIRIRHHEDGICVIELCSDDAVYVAFCRAIVKTCAAAYFHSVLALGDQRIRSMLAPYGGLVFWDVHGVVPEEFVMNNDKVNARIFGEYERDIARRADIIVCVTAAMKDHLKRKYLIKDENKLVVCPIFPSTHGGRQLASRPPSARPLVIYAGGAQKWQKISAMAKVIAALHDDVEFLVLTPAVNEVRSQFVDKGVPYWRCQENILSASHDEVLMRYSFAHYGFLLRDDSIVNNVSCPTKLIEYIGFGVVPILDSELVGDFVQLGMKFLRSQDVINNGLPDESVRLAMAESNLEVFEKLQTLSLKGLAELRDVMDDVR